MTGVWQKYTTTRIPKQDDTDCFIYYSKYILKIMQPSQYRCMQLQYRFAVTSEAPSSMVIVLHMHNQIHCASVK